MKPDDVAAQCQELLEKLRIAKDNLIFYKKTENFLALFEMGHRRNTLRAQQIDSFLIEHGIDLAHKRKARLSIREFANDESIAFRLVENRSAQSAAAFEENGQVLVANKNAGTIDVLRQDSGLQLYEHQKDALAELDQRIGRAGAGPFAGLLVLPTGGGKTLTAAHWLAQNLLDKGKKILWIAHRHELLSQAKDTFQKLAFQNILRERKSFNYRTISGIHDRPVNIKPTDDILIASKDSLNAGAGFAYLRDQWLRHQEEVFLVIDEAHHATARTYRKLIKDLQANVGQLRVLGLTATPFRTAEDEQGQLAKVFTDDIIYKIDLRTLISRGILSEPIFEEVKTKFDVASQLNLSDEDLTDIGRFDISSIGEETAKIIAKNKERNRCIVDRYIKHRKRYQQTLVFALNKENAIALKALFSEQGVGCEYVLSSIRDQGTGANNSRKANRDIIQRFRDQKLDVLININILTEGTDLPKVQSVFLTRPTISPTLMTQMMGRGLRGEKAGGTQKAYIVSFIDDWHDKVQWVNPEKLFIGGNTDFNDERDAPQKQLVKLISVSKIEEFALLANESISRARRESIENLPFIERVPLGIYYFVLLNHNDGEVEDREKNCEILVYNNIQPAYSDFLNELPSLFAHSKPADADYLSEAQLAALSDKVEAEFFAGYSLYPGYDIQDVRDVLQYYWQHKTLPAYVELEDRARFDIGAVAQHIWDADLTQRQEQEYKTKLWHDNQAEWQVFFGDKESYFIREIDLAKSRLNNPELFKKPSSVPTDTKELRRLEQFTMDEIRTINPLYWRQLSNQVYAKFRDADYYFSAKNGKRSKYKFLFQIDHIVPISKGGLTTLDNLQLLTKAENARKGTK